VVLGKGSDWLGVMTLDKSLAAIAIMSRKVERSQINFPFPFIACLRLLSTNW
jgi:hypothetical protein